MKSTESNKIDREDIEDITSSIINSTWERSVTVI